MRKKGYPVILFEKEQYPFHRVCGEYISNESREFLTGLGVDLTALGVSEITRLQVSGINGKLLDQPLPLGGFGISRYTLDHVLVNIARSLGVVIMENTKVTDIIFQDNAFIIETAKKRYSALVVCGSYGKRSNLDMKWKRPFITALKNRLNNYIGIKYHIRADFRADTISLHNFKNGYCGIVKIEEDKYCLCYLTRASNLKQSGGSIKEMEEMILSRNPNLKKILIEGERLFDEPVTISQISFDKKTQVEDHLLMIGDAAGMITPLCGNGMSMALHGSKLACGQIDLFLQEKISRHEMEDTYTHVWQKTFEPRLRMGRRIQRLFGKEWLTNLFIAIGKPFPQLIRQLVRRTHGESF